jgi:hypothetical protein
MENAPSLTSALSVTSRKNIVQKSDPILGRRKNNRIPLNFLIPGKNESLAPRVWGALAEGGLI